MEKRMKLTMNKDKNTVDDNDNDNRLTTILMTTTMIMTLRQDNNS